MYNFTSLKFISLTFCMLIGLSACTPGIEVQKDQGAVFTPTSFEKIKGWNTDDMEGAMAAFKRSCARIVKGDPNAAFGPQPVSGLYKDWQAPCDTLMDDAYRNPRAFFETWFTPWIVKDRSRKKEGLFTGYYEPELEGARYRFGDSRYPLLKRPKDLVMVDLGSFRDDLKGRRIAGRVIDGKLRPYETRAQIMRGALSFENAKPLVWVKNPVDAFFLHIQGSGRVVFEDGDYMRVGYDGQNGHPYYAIGRALIKRGVLTQEEVSLQSIRKYLEAHPKEAIEIMTLNPSYIFFRELEDEGPLGAEGIVLTPERSLAVDRTNIPYGAPVWIDIETPVEGEATLRQLMIAQDTGGAIRGAVRGDVFWGHGKRAAYMAGHMKAQGRMFVLLPKSIDPSAL